MTTNFNGNGKRLLELRLRMKHVLQQPALPDGLPLAAGQLRALVDSSYIPAPGDESYSLAVVGVELAAAPMRWVVVVPVVSNPAIAGPGDIILPEAVIGHSVAMLPSLAFSLQEFHLGKCYEQLPVSWWPALRGEFWEYRGLPFLDTEDTRYAWHAEFVTKVIEPLQAGVIAGLAKEKV